MAGGGSKPGERRGGRKHGTPNKATAARQAEVAASGITPLEYMLKVLRDENADPHQRFEAAKSAAPYVHPKLASIQHGKELSFDVVDSRATRLEIPRSRSFQDTA